MAGMGQLSNVLIVAIVVLGPIWLGLHYRARGGRPSREAEEGLRRLDELTQQANRMQTRIETLEGLLEAAQVKDRRES